MEIQVKSNTKEIMTRLVRLQSDINYLKEHTEDDLKSIEEARKDLRGGKNKEVVILYVGYRNFSTCSKISR